MTRINYITVTLTIILLCTTESMSQQLRLTTKPSLNLAVAKAVAQAAAEYAIKNNWDVVIVVVDDGGHLLYLERMDDVQIGSLEVARQKAETAVTFKRNTKLFVDAIKNGRTELIALPGGMPFIGGVPLTWNGEVIGAIGVSGMTTGEQDGLVAEAGAKALVSVVK